jgi:hypothetical protein
LKTVVFQRSCGRFLPKRALVFLPSSGFLSRRFAWYDLILSLPQLAGSEMSVFASPAPHFPWG